MKRQISLLLAFVFLVSMLPVGVFAEEETSTASTVETFESFETGKNLAEVFASGTTMATVSETRAKNGIKSAELKDTSTSSAAILRCEAEKTGVLKLDFDVFPVTGAVQFRISSGTRSNANTAFWISFTNKKGTDGVYHTYFQYYSGSAWVDVYEFSGVLANKWSAVHVEAFIDGKAKVTVDGQLIGEALRCAGTYGTNVTTGVDSVIFECGATSTTGGNYFVDNLKANSALITTEEGLRLADDLTADALTVEAGKMLDLNGYTLSVDSLACFGSIVDSSAGNAGRLITEPLILSEIAYLPVYDSAEGGYRFFDYRMKNLGVRKEADGSVTYGFSVDFVNPDAYRLISSGECGICVSMNLRWGDNRKTFTFHSDLIKQYAALQMEQPELRSAMMLNVTGLNSLEIGTDLIVTPAVEVAGKTLSGEPMVYITEEGVTETELLEIEMGPLFDIADNTEKEGLPANDPYVTEDFSASGGVYGFTQIPNVVYDPDTDRVYVNYTRHRDVIVDYPYDSTRVYNAETLLNAKAGDQLQDDYVQMKTENTMFFTAMAKLKSGKVFCQNYITYYLSDTQAATYSWIIGEDGTWTKVQGTLTIPAEIAGKGPQSPNSWHRYLFSRSMIELEDGTLVASMYGTYGTILVESKDQGKTWNYRSMIARSAYGNDQPHLNTDGSAITWVEPAVTRCADGSLLCIMRTGRDKPLYQTRSYDEGLTWSRPILMPGLDPEKKEGMSIYPHLVLLSNGVLAMATGVPGNTICFSLDGCGYNWDYSVATYSAATTGNTAITQLDYDEATGTVTLLAVGDKGFNNQSLSGIWGRVIRVSRNHVQDPVLSGAVVRAEETKLALGETYQAYVDAVFNSDHGLIQRGYSVQWHTLTPELAAVDQTGKITALNVGTAQIQAAVTWDGRTVISNQLNLEICDDSMLDHVDVTVSKWVLKIGETGSTSKTAYNSFGQEIPAAAVSWCFESLNPELLYVDDQNGIFRALASGVAELLVTVTKDDVTLTEKITIIIESGQWVMEDFDSSAAFPANCITSNLVSISTNKSYSGTRSVYINDSSTRLAPQLRFNMPDSKGVIVEFMIYTENTAHSPTFGVGCPNDDGSYNYTCNTARIGLLYNALTGAQGFQAYDGNAWSIRNRTDIIAHNQWNKIRLEITVDKPYKLYVNERYITSLPVAFVRDTLNTLYFSTGGTGYTGDAYYIDDIRYMSFD